MAITRRRFLRESAITAVGLSFASPLFEGVALGAAGQRAGGSKAVTDRIVVTINMFGGNDGLNTVVPLFQYDRYAALRPTIAIPRDRVLGLPGVPDLGFGPGMAALRDLYAAGKVAVISGVGAPPDSNGLFDHAQSQYVFQSGDAKGIYQAEAPSGWMGRYLDTVNEGLISTGINFGGGRLILTGMERQVLSLSSIEQFKLQPRFDRDARVAAYRDIQEIPTGAGGSAEYNRLMRKRAIEQSEIVQERTAGYQPAATYPEGNPLAQSLFECAQLIAADLGVRALSVGFDGYDTHVAQNDGGQNDELGYHQFLMNLVSEAVAAFQADLEGHGLADRVVVLIFSEFGRRPEENNERGTDHGLGSVAFVVGSTVRGGVYGTYPSLDEQHLVLDGNIDVTVDFRSIYATVLGSYLGADPDAILRGSFPALGFL